MPVRLAEKRGPPLGACFGCMFSSKQAADGQLTRTWYPCCSQRAGGELQRSRAALEEAARRGQEASTAAEKLSKQLQHSTLEAAALRVRRSAACRVMLGCALLGRDVLERVVPCRCVSHWVVLCRAALRCAATLHAQQGLVHACCDVSSDRLKKGAVPLSPCTVARPAFELPSGLLLLAMSDISTPPLTPHFPKTGRPGAAGS